MKLSMQTKALHDQLSAVIGAIEAKSTLAIMTHVLIKAHDGYITLIGTDLKLQLIVTRPEQIDQPGEITVAAKKLLDICKSLPGLSQVTLQEKAGKLLLTSGRSRYSLGALPAQEFPNIEETQTPTEITIQQGQLHRIIKKTMHAMGIDDVRYYMNGTCLHLIDGQLKAIATDGHRMALCAAAVNHAGESTQSIVPQRAINTLISLLTTASTDITVRIGRTHLHVELPFGDGGTLGFITSLVDGKYPDYTRVIPRNTTKTILANRDEFSFALTRAGVISNKKYNAIALSLTPDLITASCSFGEDESSESVTVEYNGESMEIGFNYLYLLDALKNVGNATASIFLTDSTGSAKITDPSDDSAVFVIMPMKI